MKYQWLLAICIKVWAPKIPNEKVITLIVRGTYEIKMKQYCLTYKQ